MCEIYGEKQISMIDRVWLVSYVLFHVVSPKVRHLTNLSTFDDPDIVPTFTTIINLRENPFSGYGSNIYSWAESQKRGVFLENIQLI